MADPDHQCMCMSLSYYRVPYLLTHAEDFIFAPACTSTEIDEEFGISCIVIHHSNKSPSHLDSDHVDIASTLQLSRLNMSDAKLAEFERRATEAVRPAN